jgi:hypothetical protein
VFSQGVNDGFAALTQMLSSHPPEALLGAGFAAIQDLHAAPLQAALLLQSQSAGQAHRPVSVRKVAASQAIEEYNGRTSYQSTL